jgi:deoxyribodipyrimidine photo-lyase
MREVYGRRTSVTGAMARTAIVWFRRDLRVHDHPALHRAVSEFDRVVPVFVLDDALLRGRYRSDARARFMLGCLEELDASLRERGSGLTVLHGRPEVELPKLAADAILFSADVSPYARARDARIGEGMEGTYVIDLAAIAPRRVFSPWQRAWSALPRRAVLAAPEAIPTSGEGAWHLSDSGVPRSGEGASHLSEFGDALGLGRGVPEPVREPGERAARAALDEWLDGPVDGYGAKRSPRTQLAGGDEPTASRLSPYLRWGCLSPRECEERALARGTGGAKAWVRQLAWRDFHAHNLLHHPENVRLEQQERFRDLEFDDAPERLAAWAEGRTGFPLVDAGMRELAATGYMHNRVRLVCGSFLTKELHLDWRLGEEHFSRLLLDGEPAQNNGNWQWIAGTGTDPAPYFRRMYNPALHQQRFDPDGTYVRRWVPELRDVPLDRLAEPWGLLEAADYPPPIVDRKVERERAAERYRAATAG